jgi:NAD(P)-dependent dehydrogenase (short-subunit alcohol dehydrogenase family)
MQGLEHCGLGRRQELCRKCFTMKFKHQKIVITGGTSGIGLATARFFLQEGARVTVTGRDAGRVASAQAEGIAARVVNSNARKALDSFFTEHGPVDHLVIAVGGSKGMGEFATLSLRVLREGFDEKFWPQVETLQAALPVLNAGASVTLVAGSASRLKQPGIAGLAAINGALELMVPVLSQELRSVRVNAVSPGVVDTPWWNFLPPEDREAAIAQFTASIPAKRPSRPDEIAEAIAFLAGNDYMTGKVIGIDGGLS